MRGEIKKLYDVLNTTFIYVTHDQTEAMTLGTKIVVMKDGIIRQVASPKELYEEPANIFVAQFIGIPQMNLLDVKVYRTLLGCYLRFADGSKFDLSDGISASLTEQGYAGKNIVFGIRPEDVCVTEDGPMEAVIEVYELLGSESYIYFTFCGHRISAKVRADIPLKVGDTIRFTWKQDKVHLFNKESEDRIWIRNENHS